MKKLVLVLLAGALVSLLTACSGQSTTTGAGASAGSVAAPQEQVSSNQGQAKAPAKDGEMILTINDRLVPVTWEDNAAVSALHEQSGQAPIVVQMSMYGGNEQVGSLGTRYPASDAQTTTHCGDVVLYSGSNIVVFYGSNDWAYTRLGKIELPDEQIRQLLSNGDVTLTLSVS